jgi:zinc protease
MSTVRDQQGLTYHINSSVGGVDDLCDGHWAVNGSFAPNLLEKGINATVEQIKKWREEGISQEELNSKKSTIIGQFKVSMSTSTGLASAILVNAERGRPVKFLDEYPEIIGKLTVEQVRRGCVGSVES